MDEQSASGESDEEEVWVKEEVMATGYPSAFGCTWILNMWYHVVCWSMTVCNIMGCLTWLMCTYYNRAWSRPSFSGLPFPFPVHFHELKYVGHVRSWSDRIHRLCIYQRFLFFKLLSCIVLNERNTVFARSGPQHVIGLSLGPPECWTQTVYRSVPKFLQGTLGDSPTDRPTDHATRSSTIPQGDYLVVNFRHV